MINPAFLQTLNIEKAILDTLKIVVQKVEFVGKKSGGKDEPAPSQEIKKYDVPF